MYLHDEIQSLIDSKPRLFQKNYENHLFGLRVREEVARKMILKVHRANNQNLVTPSFELSRAATRNVKRPGCKLCTSNYVNKTNISDEI